MKNIARQLTPPLLWSAMRAARARVTPTPEPTEADLGEASLFGGHGQLFARLASHASLYGEYGVGQSTRWVHANTDARILAVDTSEDWIASVRAEIGDEPRVTLRYVDVGPVRAWGWPVSYARRDNFGDYPMALWTGPERPDLVLVDGRFRVACFLTTMLEAAPGTPVLFDDYVGRPAYSIVEEFFAQKDACGRQVLFETPKTFDRDAVAALRDQFQYVLE